MQVISILIYIAYPLILFKKSIIIIIDNLKNNFIIENINKIN